MGAGPPGLFLVMGAAGGIVLGGDLDGERFTELSVPRR